MPKKRKRILIAFGTRPEIIKLGPVYRAFTSDPHFDVDVYASGQHTDLAKGLLSLFKIQSGRTGSTIVDLPTVSAKFGRMVQELTEHLVQSKPDWVIVQGDTTTAAAAAVSAFLNHIPVGHVEAGLRTHDLQSPWPEEFNRRLISLCTSLHFAPTQQAFDNLIEEGYAPESIHLTGNTVIDALLYAHARIGDNYVPHSRDLRSVPLDGRVILVTGHRRENVGPPLRRVLEALKSLADDGDKTIVFPVHLNPTVRQDVFELLGDTPHIHLIEPLEYTDFVHVLSKAWLVITDSGGVQEEAPTFAKPVLITRESTERPEVVTAGFGHLVGSNVESICRLSRLFTERAEPVRLRGLNPFGDGRASERILQAVRIAAAVPALTTSSAVPRTVLFAQKHMEASLAHSEPAGEHGQVQEKEIPASSPVN